MSPRILFFLAFIFILFSCNDENKTEQENTSASATEADIDALSEKISASPKDASLYYQRGQLFLKAGNTKMAIQDLEQAITIDSTKGEYYLPLADAYFFSKIVGKSRQTLERAINNDPANNTEAVMKLAELHFYVQEYKKSIEYLDQVLMKDRHNPKAYFMKGMNFKEMGDTTRAISSFQTTVEQNPEYYAAYMQLGIIFNIKNDPISVQYYNSALNLNPGSTEALYGRAMFFQENEEYNKAITDYTQILNIEPGNANAHFNLGYIHQVHLKIYDQAIKHYTDAIAANPQYAEAYYNRGLTYETLGNINAAAADYRLALQFRPEYPAAEAGLSRVG
ncbi:MAG: tetratricopeptide repeat protein [Bacteroidia bacterium]